MKNVITRQIWYKSKLKTTYDQKKQTKEKPKLQTKIPYHKNKRYKIKQNENKTQTYKTISLKKNKKQTSKHLNNKHGTLEQNNM